MSKKKTISQLQAELERAEHDRKITDQNIRILKEKQTKLTRRERTHRLCTHGGMIERYLDPAVFTDEQISRLLKDIFSMAEIKELLEKVKKIGSQDQSPS